MQRRAFLATTAGPLLLAQSPPSDPIRLGVIGSGSRGRFVMKIFLQDPAVRVTGVCDVYEPNLEAGLSAAGNQAKSYRRYQALLDNKEIQAVLIATPDHWHHRMLLDAMAAGKDVYVEKPLCHSWQEGVELVEAAKRSRSVVQVGMQRRSYDLYRKARVLVQDGTLGQVSMVRCWWLNNALQPVTGKLQGPLDWEQWQGPAKRQPSDPARFLDWRSYSEYSGGILTDQGAHVFDGVNMLMNASYPSAVTALAAPAQKAGTDTPLAVTTAADYPEGFVAVFSINHAAMRYPLPQDQLNQLDGTKARLDIGREHFELYMAGAEKQAARRETSGGMTKATEEHVRNFLECVRTRAVPNAPVEAGFQAALVTLMANIALREGRRVRWDRERRAVV